jgi:hypothetical protein
VRGQVSVIAAERLARCRLPPVAGAGYVLPPVDGRVVFGATAQERDDDPAVRASTIATTSSSWSACSARRRTCPSTDCGPYGVALVAETACRSSARCRRPTPRRARVR